MTILRFVSCSAFVILAAAPGSALGGDVAFLRGDANADGRVSVSDALAIVEFTRRVGAAPRCLDAADADDNGRTELDDALFVVDAIANLETEVPEPTPDVDGTSDKLGCRQYDVTEPGEVDTVLRNADVPADPGATIDIPLLMTNAVVVEGVQILIHFDPALFRPIELRFEDTALTVTPLLSRLTVDPNQGLVVAVIVPELESGRFRLEPGEQQRIVNIRGRVAEYAEPGRCVELDLTSGDHGDGVGPLRLQTELAHSSVVDTADSHQRPVLRARASVLHARRLECRPHS